MASDNVVERLRAEGILNPRMVIAEAQRAGLRLDFACAMLQKESGGGSNVFGHDPTIFVGAGTVTRAKYQEYKRQRVASGNDLMQGVGPTQLTYYTLQDRADAQGGCWKPRINMRVGFKHLADNIRAHGEADGARRYNGSGDAAVAYSKDLLAKAARWRAVLDGAVPVVVPAADGPLKLGSHGPQVVRLTRRLATLRSKAGTPYLDKPRKKLDAAAEGALKAFQSEHRLVPDGVFGPLSQRKLNRALRLQAKRKVEKKVATPATPGTPAKQVRKSLKPLVVALHHADAETGEAWEAVVAHAANRKRMLKRATAKAAARGPETSTVLVEGFAAVTKALAKIDGTLDAIAEDLDGDTDAGEGQGREQDRRHGAGNGQGRDRDDREAVEDGQRRGGGRRSPKAAPWSCRPRRPRRGQQGPAPPSRRRHRGSGRRRGARSSSDLSDEELLDRIDAPRPRARPVAGRDDPALHRGREGPHPDRAGARSAGRREGQDSAGRQAGEGRTAGREAAAEALEGRRPRLRTALNEFTSKHLVGMGDLLVDGEIGPAEEAHPPPSTTSATREHAQDGDRRR